MDDALYFANNDKIREYFEVTLKNVFSLILIGKSKWYLGIIQTSISSIGTKFYVNIEVSPICKMFEEINIVITEETTDSH